MKQSNSTVREATERSTSKAINRGIARLLGGDATVWNTDRILRPPGTTNYPNRKKRKKDGRVPEQVTLVVCEPDRRFSPSAFAAAARHGAIADSGKVAEYEERELTDEEEVFIESLNDEEGRLGELYRRDECENDSDHDMKLADAVARKISAKFESGIVVEEVLRRSRDDYGSGENVGGEGRRVLPPDGR